MMTLMSCISSVSQLFSLNTFSKHDVSSCLKNDIGSSIHGHTRHYVIFAMALMVRRVC